MNARTLALRSLTVELGQLSPLSGRHLAGRRRRPRGVGRGGRSRRLRPRRRRVRHHRSASGSRRGRHVRGGDRRELRLPRPRRTRRRRRPHRDRLSVDALPAAGHDAGGPRCDHQPRHRVRRHAHLLSHPRTLDGACPPKPTAALSASTTPGLATGDRSATRCQSPSRVKSSSTTIWGGAVQARPADHPSLREPLAQMSGPLASRRIPTQPLMGHVGRVLIRRFRDSAWL
jgi:hypothetical protein